MRWRGVRVAEGAPLLREYRVCSSIEGSNPSLSTILNLNHLIVVFLCLKFNTYTKLGGGEPSTGFDKMPGTFWAAASVAQRLIT